MSKPHLVIDPEVHAGLKAEAIRRGLKLKALATKIIAAWLARRGPNEHRRKAG